MRSEIFRFSLEAKAAAKARPAIEVPSLWGYSLKILLALAVVLSVILLFAYLLRRVRVASFPFSRQKRIEVLEFVPLMGKWGVALVRVGRRKFLVGLAEGAITLLAEVEDRDLEEETFAKALEDNM